MSTPLVEILSFGEDDLAPVEPLTFVVVLVRRREGVLLVFNRDKQHWELAGGLLEAGESLRECGRRELEEESGQLVAPESLRFLAAIKVLVDHQAGVPPRVERLSPIDAALIAAVRASV